MFFWPKAVGRFVPGALAALLIGTLVALPFDIPKLASDLPQFTSLADRFPDFTLPGIDRGLAFLIVEAAIILALLGAIDSLLTSLVADNATRTQHDSNRELFGQGVGNTLAGLFGAIPGAGATMRTVANIRSGGRTRLSGMIAASLLFLTVIALMPLAGAIPHAVLGGILVKVGWDIIDIAYIRRAHKGPRWDLLLMVLVLLVTVFVDLITAVGIGVFLAALGFVHSVAKDQLAALGDEDVTALTLEEQALYDQAGGRVRIFEFSGPLSFGAAADLAHHVDRHAKDDEVLVLDFGRMPDIDVSAAYAIRSIVENSAKEKRAVLFANMSDAVAERLRGLDIARAEREASRGLTRRDALARAIPPAGEPAATPAG